MERSRLERVRAELRSILNSNSISRSGSQLPNLSIFEELYELGDRISKLPNSYVNKCRQRSTGLEFAVKVLHCQDPEEFSHVKETYRNLRRVEHPAIIKARRLFVCEDERKCYLVMAYCPLPSLREAGVLREEDIRLVSEELLSALSEIHDKGVCHRDIKPDNILIDQRRRKVLLIDFGISKAFRVRRMAMHMSTYSGTLAYTAPEILLGGEYSYLIDIWSLGVTLYELSFGYRPFQGEYLHQLKQNILEQEVEFPSKANPKLVSFLKCFLQKQPDKRSTAEELQKHPFLMPGRVHFSLISRTHSLNGQRKQRCESADSSRSEGEQLDFSSKQFGERRCGIIVQHRRVCQSRQLLF